MLHRLAIFALAATAASLAWSTAFAERVTWRVSGVITIVGTNAQRLPFTASVGQPFVIDMTMDNDSTAVIGGPSGTPNTASYHNVYSAVVYVGNNQMIITPSQPWSTTLWNDYVIQSVAYDYYRMPIVDATTQWEAAWAVQTSVTSGTGPLTSLSLLLVPPNLSLFQFKQMTLVPSGGGYEPAITASLDSIVVVGANPPSPTASQNNGSGGGAIDGALLSLLLIGALTRETLRYRRRIFGADVRLFAYLTGA